MKTSITGCLRPRRHVAVVFLITGLGASAVISLGDPPAKEVSTESMRSARPYSMLTGPNQPIETVAGGATAEIRLTPVVVYPGGPYETGGYYSASDISGQRLTVEGPGRTYWNMQILNWGAGGHTLGLYSGMITWESLLGANADCGGGPGSCPAAGNLVLANPTCGTATDCDNAFGEPAAACDASSCAPGFINEGRVDWVLDTLPGDTNSVCNFNNPDGPVCGSVSLDNESRTDGGELYYGATLVIDVPPTARGLYTLQWDPTQTF